MLITSKECTEFKAIMLKTSSFLQTKEYPARYWDIPGTYLGYLWHFSDIPGKSKFSSHRRLILNFLILSTRYMPEGNSIMLNNNWRFIKKSWCFNSHTKNSCILALSVLKVHCRNALTLLILKRLGFSHREQINILLCQQNYFVDVNKHLFQLKSLHSW